MYLYIKIILRTLLICLFFLKCENDPINITSDYIQSDIQVISFNISDSESCTFQNGAFQDCLDQAIDIDSVQIEDSYRLYSGYPIDSDDSFDSYILFNIDVSKMSGEAACLDNNFSSVKVELSSYNQFIDMEFNEETEEDEVSEVYVDESGIDVYIGDLNIDWDNMSSINYNDFISNNNFDVDMENIDFELKEYDIVLDSLEKYISNFCSLSDLDIVVKYQNSLNDDDIYNYIEIVSSDYIFQPSQPQIYVDYNLLEQETIIENKYALEGVSENNQSIDFNTSVVSDTDSNDWGRIYLVNSSDVDGSDLSSALHIDSLNITSPLISNISEPFLDIQLNVTFSINDQDLEVENFLPIEFYIQDFVAYTESDDPIGDNWRDCGSDGLCLGDLDYDEIGEDLDGSEGNGVWDLGEGYEENNILDWVDDNGNNVYDFGESLIENYNDFGIDDCPNIYEMGIGHECASEEGQNSYNDTGTENNEIYDSNEFFEDIGEDGCLDMYEDGLGGCLPDDSSYDEELNPDPNGDNYNIDPSSDNWKDYGLDGCFDEDETGDLNNLCDSSSSSYDEELNPDPNGDNYDFLNNSEGTEGNGLWNEGELTEGNGKYDNGEIFYDVGSNGLTDSMEEYPSADNYDEFNNPNGTEGNGVWDIGEPFEDYGTDATVNYLEDNYNLSGTESNGLYNSNEPFVDMGEDGCSDEDETGDLENPCDSDNSTYDEELNLDPNQDNYLVDINLDDWRDCGSDGLCYGDTGYEEQDLDGTENNSIWDFGEGTELNGKIDWFDENLNNIIDKNDCLEDGAECESWNDYGQDLIPDSLEFLELGSYLSSNIIHDSGMPVDFYLDQDVVIDINDFVDDSKDVNVWISDIDLSSDLDFYDAIVNLRFKSPTKAVEFKIEHSPNIYLDSINNNYTSIFYGGTDSLVNDISIYSINQLNSEQSLNKIILNYDQGAKAHLDFEGLHDFISSDSSMFIDKTNSNLILYANYIDDDYYFDLGFSDIYYSNNDSDIFLKRIYFDNVDSIVIPIGGLMQQFIDKTLLYDGINLKIDGNGYNFNRPVFFKYGEDANSVFNPKLNIMYSE